MSQTLPSFHAVSQNTAAMSDTDGAITEVYRKIEREKALINAASHMRTSTNNAAVQARVDSNIRDSRRNIGYLEEKLQELQLRKMGRSDDGGPPPPAHGGPGYGQPRGGRGGPPGGPNGPMPPPKDGQHHNMDRADHDPGHGSYRQGESGMMPPRAPYGDPRQYNTPVSKARPNFSKLGMSAVLIWWRAGH